MIEFAIVGLGSWGLCVLERTAHLARTSEVKVRVHVVEPRSPGGGVYGLDQPDYLVLNNPCGQLSLYASPDPDHSPSYAVGLYEWAASRRYSWVGHECRPGGGGRPIAPTDYLPRRVMGEYLLWFYRALLDECPPTMEVVHHAAAAVDIVPGGGGTERVRLDDGTEVRVDHVVLTSGHTWNDDEGTPGVAYTRPYPVEHLDAAAPPGAPVAIAGMGLVAYDMLAALTVGRGGCFEDHGDRLRYRASGREPQLHFFSRSGVPSCVKSAHGIDPTGAYQPVVCTPGAFADAAGRGRRRAVDFRRDLLPLIYAEMQVRFHLRAAEAQGGPVAAADVRRRLGSAWRGGTFDAAVAALAASHGSFDPAGTLFAGQGRRFDSGRDYEAVVYDMVATDLDDALAPGGSPVKAAQEVTRVLRDQLRSVIEFGGLSLESYIDFQSNVRGRINRLEAGPPALRSAQLLALMDAGVARVPFGPSPSLAPAPGARVTLSSTQLERPYAATVTAVVRGHLDLPSLSRSGSVLLKRLYANGRLTQLHYGDTAVGSVAISDTFHPYDAEGRLQPRLSLLGVLTEGVRYFTHYLPSPKSRLRAVLDAQSCVDAILAG